MKQEDLDVKKRTSRHSSRRNRDNKKAPLILRVVAWVSMAVIFFSLGYVCSGWLLNYLDSRGVGGQPHVVSRADQVDQLVPPAKEDAQKLVDMGKHAVFSIYVLDKSGKIKKVDVKLSSGLMEEDLQKVINSLLGKLVEVKFLAEDVKLNHVFRNGEKVYLDFNQPFFITLSKLSPKKGSLLITGIVRTVVDNFMSVKRVQFLIDGKVPEEAGEVPLSVPWELKKK